MRWIWVKTKKNCCATNEHLRPRRSAYRGRHDSRLSSETSDGISRLFVLARKYARSSWDDDDIG